MISILSVNRNAREWMELLVKSIRKFTTVPYEILILDNNSQDDSVKWLSRQKDVQGFVLGINLGHGPGLDYLLPHATYQFCLVLDIDAHIQRKNWDFDLLDLYRKGRPKRRLICAKGGDPEGKLSNEEIAKKYPTGDPKVKPIHPCWMFFPTQFFRKHKLKFVARQGHDVGRKVYWDVLKLGYEVMRIPLGYESGRTKFYPGAWGDEYYIYQKPTLYHQWYSSRIYGKAKVDNLTKEEFEKRKKILFNQPLVKEILNA